MRSVGVAARGSFLGCREDEVRWSEQSFIKIVIGPTAGTYTVGWMCMLTPRFMDCWDGAEDRA